MAGCGLERGVASIFAQPLRRASCCERIQSAPILPAVASCQAKAI